jgi:predicted AlkP superfamily pyrophosphatase or phosphodiesterase
MKRILLGLLLSGYAITTGSAWAAAPPKKPKLIVAIVVDQFRYDYLLRFRKDYTAGFKTLLEQGAVFDDAHYIHYPTVTAVGHSTFLTGATPSLSGIVSNSWYDRESKKNVTSVSDDNTSLVGAPNSGGSSPRRLLVSTLGDEIRMQGVDSKVIGISIKDRSAILPAGHMANAAYWFDSKTNQWVTSSYYMNALPAWVASVNAAKPASRAEGASWFALDAKHGDPPLCTMLQDQKDVRTCGSLEASPWGNELIEELAVRALTEEKLGQHAATDLLTVSFSSNDYVGHAVGPDDPEVRDISIRTDRLLGKLIEAAAKQAGMDNVLFVLTADHGVAPVPEVNTARKMPGGRLRNDLLTTTLQTALDKKYGPGKWIDGAAGEALYLNQSLIAQYKLNKADVERTAADSLRQLPHIFRVYTATDLREGRIMNDNVSAALSYGFYEQRSGDIFVIPEPFYMYDATGTTHGTPFDYDSHVPVIFMGAGIKPGHYYQKIAVNDIAPTLAAIDGVEAPSGSIGRVLQEMWQ